MGDIFRHVAIFSRGHYSGGEWVQTSVPSKWGSDGFGGYGNWGNLVASLGAKGISETSDYFEFPAFGTRNCSIFCRIFLGSSIRQAASLAREREGA